MKLNLQGFMPVLSVGILLVSLGFQVGLQWLLGHSFLLILYILQKSSLRCLFNVLQLSFSFLVPSVCHHVSMYPFHYKVKERNWRHHIVLFYSCLSVAVWLHNKIIVSHSPVRNPILLSESWVSQRIMKEEGRKRKWKKNPWTHATDWHFLPWALHFILLPDFYENGKAISE